MFELELTYLNFLGSGRFDTKLKMSFLMFEFVKFKLVSTFETNF